jgi:hypothetical protein
MYEREDWTLFRSLGTLSQKAGVAVERLPALVAKELVDNALDTGAGCQVGILDGNGFWVEDDGDGIDGSDAEIAELFSIKRPMRTSKLKRLPTRGALGNGLRVVAGAVLASGGSLELQTNWRGLRLIPQDDGTTIYEQVSSFMWGGTRIEVRLGESLPVNDETLAWARHAIALSADESRYGGKTSPHWYDSEAFYELLQAAQGQTVRDVIEEFEGCSGPKAGKIAAEFKLRLASELTREEADGLLAEARTNAREVKPERLGGLGPVIEGLPRGYAKLTGKYERKAARGDHNAEIPFVLEAYAEFANEGNCEVSVNRTPITGNIEAFHHKESLYVSGCGLDHAFTIGRKSIRVCLNIETPHMPITSDGKAPNLLPFFSQICSVLEKAVKRAKKGMADTGDTKTPTVKDVILGCLEDAGDKASGSGEYRFSIRQLFYAVRPYVLEALEMEPEYNYFAKVLTDYEAEKAEISGMYRDPRGTVYHPHTGEEIQLGTMQVESYERPEWLFKNVLYCEKEGLFPVLKAAQWPERHDCALMTSKGFASRAARDLLDLLGESGEELQVFCIHDADAAGTLIYQALQEGTKARPGRKIRIINLGLEPAEALDMGLQVESVKRNSNRRQPVADYVEADWKEWLQDSRVELNAMTTPQLLDWLDGKLAEHGGKLVSPADVLESLESGIRSGLQQQITDDVLREARVADRVESEFHKRLPVIEAALEILPTRTREELIANPADHWTGPVANFAQVIVDSALIGPGMPFRSSDEKATA